MPNKSLKADRVRSPDSFSLSILCQFGYPPDMQLLSTETALKQAEMIENELVG